jgi:hypothetical protein
MIEHIRFGVTDYSGLQSATWKVWTLSANGQKDVYIVCRNIGSTMKLSLHDSGQWHLAYNEQKFDSMFEKGCQPESRYIEKWHRPIPGESSGLTLACRVLIPWYAVSIPVATLKKDIHWIDAPQIGHSIEITIVLSPPHITKIALPDSGKLIGPLSLTGRENLWVVYRAIPYIEPVFPSSPSGKFFRESSEYDLLNQGLRACIYSLPENGLVTFFEAPVTVYQDQVVFIRE